MKQPKTTVQEFADDCDITRGVALRHLDAAVARGECSRNVRVETSTRTWSSGITQTIQRGKTAIYTFNTPETYQNALSAAREGKG